MKQISMTWFTFSIALAPAPQSQCDQAATIHNWVRPYDEPFVEIGLKDRSALYQHIQAFAFWFRHISQLAASIIKALYVLISVKNDKAVKICDCFKTKIMIEIYSIWNLLFDGFGQKVNLDSGNYERF